MKKLQHTFITKIDNHPVYPIPIVTNIKLDQGPQFMMLILCLISNKDTNKIEGYEIVKTLEEMQKMFIQLGENNENVYYGSNTPNEIFKDGSIPITINGVIPDSIFQTISTFQEITPPVEDRFEPIITREFKIKNQKKELVFSIIEGNYCLQAMLL